MKAQGRMDYELFAASTACSHEPLLIAGETVWTHGDVLERATERARGIAMSSTVHVLEAEERAETLIEFCAIVIAGGVAALIAPNEPVQRRLTRLTKLEDWKPKLRPFATRFDGRLPIDVVFTSGSTGEPRAVVHGLENHAVSADGAAARIPFGPGDRWLLSLPFHHIAGLSIWMRALRSGGSVALRLPGEPLVDALIRTRATHCSLVAKQASDLLDRLATRRPAVRLDLRAALVGGGPVPTRLIERAKDAAIPMHGTYGMTETTAQVATARSDDAESVGHPLPGRHITIRGGEILVDGSGIALGRIEGDSLVPLADDDGHFATGDLGRLTGDGRLCIQGRKDRRFVSGGENVSPEEIEAALRNVAATEEVYVVAVPDHRWGERPVAFVADIETPRELRRHSCEARLLAELAARLPRFLVPDHVYALPHSTSLKPSLVELKRLAQQDRPAP
ncbi:MAG: AMP-binding protein [Planctomycetes bacterium]|nr:AMP-binding protein [Planctomycetota bacterium]